jgi:putative oxidoreductase
LIKKFLVSITPESSSFNELSMTALRVFAGASMAFAHGLGKLPPSEGLIGKTAEMGFPEPLFFAWAAALSEFVGGLMIAGGLLTRVGALFVAFTMIVAAFGAHAADPFGKQELSLFYLVVSLVFLVRGSGRISVDRFLN